MATVELSTSARENTVGTENPIAFPLTEVKARLGISRSTAYVEIAAGRLKAIKVGSRTLISTAAALEWLGQLPEARQPSEAALPGQPI